MEWLLLRGLAREQKHWGEFPSMLAARVAGARPVMLDLPGAGTEHKRAVPRTVSEITDDLRGRFFADSARKAGEARAILAVSLGGMIALDWCARYPQDFSRAVVINTSAGDAAPFWERLDWRNYPRVFGALTSSDPLRVERTIIDLTMNRPDFDRAALAAQWAEHARAQPVAKSAVVRQLLAAARSKLPASLSTPVLVLASHGDRLVRPACSERLAAKLGLPIRLHDSGGHDLPFDAPDWICAEISEWLKQSA